MDEVLIPGNSKEVRVFGDKKHVMETAIAGDVALVHAWKADEVGNLIFRLVCHPLSALSLTLPPLT